MLLSFPTKVHKIWWKKTEPRHNWREKNCQPSSQYSVFYRVCLQYCLTLFNIWKALFNKYFLGKTQLNPKLKIEFSLLHLIQILLLLQSLIQNSFSLWSHHPMISKISPFSGVNYMNHISWQWIICLLLFFF